MIWAACCLMFCGSLRVHEVLGKQKNPVPSLTLMGSDLAVKSVKIGSEVKELVQVLIKSPKENRVGAGVVIEIFGNDTFMCPVRAVKKLEKKIKPSKDMPYFTWLSGEAYTGKDLNGFLSKTLDRITLNSGGSVRSHSFRAAIPTLMGLAGFSQNEIQAHGRWSSTAFKAYIKKTYVKRLKFTEKWVNTIVCNGEK